MGRNQSYAKLGCSKSQSFGRSQGQQTEISETHNTNRLPGIRRIETKRSDLKIEIITMIPRVPASGF